MTSVKSIEAGKYNLMLAEALKKESDFAKPEWVDFVKSGTSKVRPIAEVDFWHKRAASILRQIYLNDIVGVQRLRTRYGSNKNRGNKPSEFRRASGKIIRLILQQSEKAGFVKKSEGVKKGRMMTDEGKKFLENVAGGKS
jgi:small subunit ribosomal protein S19e